jgi:hypothetical protein
MIDRQLDPITRGIVRVMITIRYEIATHARVRRVGKADGRIMGR